MDRISHNEGLVICSILYLMVGNVKEISRINLLTVLSVDGAIRKRLSKYNNYFEFINSEAIFDQALNRKFKEFQPIILNAMTMMQMTGIIEHGKGTEIELTVKGCWMAIDANDLQSEAVHEIRFAVDYLNNLVNGIETTTLYKNLQIIL